MGRKHGFRGTPVRPSPIPSSVGGIFERRGDPLVSSREGREKYGRNLETEDPDFDRYFAEDVAREWGARLLKPKQIAKGEEFRKANVKPATAQQLAHNILMRRKQANRATHVVVEEPQPNTGTVRGNFYLFTRTDAPLPKLKVKRKGR